MAFRPIFVRSILLSTLLANGAFTLVELLVVLGIISLLTLLAIPALQGLQKAGNFSREVYDMADSINFARSYAQAENTYVYLGLTEIDRSQNPGANPQNAGLGRVALAAVAAKNGANGGSSTSSASWNTSYANGDNFNLVRPVQNFEGMYIAPGLPTATTGGMVRPTLGVDNAKSDTTLLPSSIFPATPFSLPLGSALGGGKYNFSSAIPFSPQGQIILNGTAVQWIEIDLQPYVGSVTPAPPVSANQGDQAALVIDGATGAISVYRP